MAETTQAQQLAQLAIQINFYMMSVSQQKGYATPESCVSYINSTVLSWKNEATAYSEWRDACWLAMTSVLDNLLPSDPVPTIDEVTAALPIIAWPN